MSLPTTTPFSIGRGMINLTSCIDSFKYIGHRVSGRGVEKPSLANLPVWISNLKKASLQPDQNSPTLRIS